MKKFCLILMIISIAIFFISCGKNNIEDESITYGTKVLDLPDANAGLDIPVDEYKLRDWIITENSIFRVGTGKDGAKTNWYIQKLTAPYETWITEKIQHTVQIEGVTYVVQNVCVAPTEKVFLCVHDDQLNYRLAEWDFENVTESREIAQETEVYLRNWMVDKDGNAYFYSNTSFSVLKKDSVNLVSIPVSGELKTVLTSSDGVPKAFVCRKTGVAGFGVYSYENNDEIVSPKEIAQIINGQGKLIWDENGDIFYIDKNEISQIGINRTKLVNFLEQNAGFSNLLQACKGRDEFKILVDSDFDGKLQLIIVAPGITQKESREEIVVAAMPDDYLSYCIMKFNRENPDYYVTLEPWTDYQETFSEYTEKLQLEMSAGRGPDLIRSDIIDLRDYGNKGFLLPLDSYFPNVDEDLVNAALESGTVDGICYAIPYSFRLYTMVSIDAVAGNRKGWNVEEMLNCMEENGIMTLYPGARPWDVVYYCVCLDEKSKTFIDWEGKTANFQSEEFIRLLEFAKNHGDQKEDLYCENLYEEMLSGKYVIMWPGGYDGVSGYIDDLQELKGNTRVLGFPVEEGSGSMLQGRGFAVNKSSNVKEGAIDFLRFLTSYDNQSMMANNQYGFAINKNVLEEQIKERIKELPDDISVSQGTMDLYEWEMLTQDLFTSNQAEELLEVINESRAYSTRFNAITKILYEETQPFFAGERTAEDVAMYVQNRVQLYLNEQR